MRSSFALVASVVLAAQPAQAQSVSTNPVKAPSAMTDHARTLACTRAGEFQRLAAHLRQKGNLAGADRSEKAYKSYQARCDAANAQQGAANAAQGSVAQAALPVAGTIATGAAVVGVTRDKSN